MIPLILHIPEVHLIIITARTFTLTARTFTLRYKYNHARTFTLTARTFTLRYKYNHDYIANLGNMYSIIFSGFAFRPLWPCWQEILTQIISELMSPLDT